jgi:hypothetical protein
MNTLCLENYGVSKMETREIKTTDGGFIQYWAAACLVAYYAGYGAHHIYDTYIK